MESGRSRKRLDALEGWGIVVQPYRVLVVEDSEVTRAILARVLRQAGFEVLEARDGVEAALIALREVPSVVVTDLEMPILDGFPLLRLLKSEPSTAHIPVLILTSHGEAASRFWSLHTGADDYLTKDDLPDRLIGTVGRLAEGAPPAVGPPALSAGAEIGPLDILARVARQLDAGLLQATLVNTLLERGMAAADFHDACRVSLRTLGEVIDARFFAVGLRELEGITVHIVREQPAPADLDPTIGWQLYQRLAPEMVLEGLPESRVPLDLEVTGQVLAEGAGDGESEALEIERAEFFALPMRGGRGLLAIEPRNPAQFATTGRPLLDSLAGHLALVLDNSRLSQRLRELSSLDSLTRQLNRRAVFDRLVEELERSRRYRHPLTLIVCDFDHFKNINDTLGHQAGDVALREGALRLRRCLRASDVFGRYGGEEFLVVMPEEELEAGLQVAERLRRCLEEKPILFPPDTELRLTASFGVASTSELESRSADLLVSLADRRLYEAKAAGRNCVRPLAAAPVDKGA